MRYMISGQSARAMVRLKRRNFGGVFLHFLKGEIELITIKCDKKTFPSLEMFLFSKMYVTKPKQKIQVVVGNDAYDYDYIYEFDNWRIVTV